MNNGRLPLLVMGLLLAGVAGTAHAEESGAAGVPVEPDISIVQWDVARYILETMQTPCKSGECNAAVNALAVQVMEQITADMDVEEIAIVHNVRELAAAEDPDDLYGGEWDTSAPTNVSEALDFILAGSEVEVNDETGFKPGGYIMRGVADSVCGPVAWMVNIHRQHKYRFAISVTVSGDCGCREVFGTEVGAFKVLKDHMFELPERDPEAINPNLYAQPYGNGRCFLQAVCPCAAEGEEDAAADQDAPASTGWQLVLNPGLRLAKTRETVCVGAKPCARDAMPGIRELIEQVILEHNKDRVLNFTVKPPERQDMALMRQASGLFEGARGDAEGDGNGGFWAYYYSPRMSFAGTLPSPCGEGMFNYELDLTLYFAGIDDLLNEVLVTRFVMYGKCDCDPSAGTEQLTDVQYTFDLVEKLRYNYDTRMVEFEEESRQCDIRANCYCPAAEAGDPVPLGGDEWVVSFDSAHHCTYGGGSTTFWLPSSPLGGPLITPLPLPVPPGVQLPPTPTSFAPPGTTTVPAAGTPADNPDAVTDGGEQTISTSGLGIGEGAGEEGEEEEQTGTPEAEPVDPWEELIEEPAPVETVYVTVKATNSALQAGSSAAGAQGMVTFAPEPDGVPGEAMAEHDTESGAGEAENSYLIEAGETRIAVSAALAELLGSATLDIDITPQSGNVLRFDGLVAAADVLPEALLGYVQGTIALNGDTYIATSVPTHLLPGIEALIAGTSAMAVEVDICVDPKPLADPFFSSRETWSQPYPDQWGIQRVGFTDDAGSAWSAVQAEGEPVVIAVIDSGLDWNHLEIPRSSLWRNPGEIPANGLDDDGNGYADDMIGWDFWDNDRKPWDVDGHGTFVSGVMFAEADNEVGIAGISRNARLMVLKAMNAFGHSRASKVAQAILYAVDNGARVINLSLGGPGTSTVVREAIRYAYENNVVVVVAAGNEAVPARDQVVAGVPYALTVAASNVRDQRSVYSNYGAGVDVAAPGDDILSLRARRTDLLLNIPGVDYEAETAFVGGDRRYYRASGTSFATPIVAGIAGLLIANNPQLTAAQVMRMIRQSARDIETPGVDHFTGYGLVDAAAALAWHPDRYITAHIDGAEVAVQNGKQFLRVLGRADADRLRKVELMIGPGEQPQAWSSPYKAEGTGTSGVLGHIPAAAFAGQKQWTIRLLVTHKNGSSREFRFLLNLG